MNNWRLLLTLVAVFQPVVSFTDRSFVDGSEQCCGRQPHSTLRDIRSPFHGPSSYTKASERRINERDDTREERRSELRFYDSASSRFGRDSHSLRNLERDTREPVLRSQFKATRAEPRLETGANSQSRELLEETREIRNSRDIKPEERNRILYRSKDVLRQNVRKIQQFDVPLSRHETRRLQIRSQEFRGALSDEDRRNTHTVRRTRDTLARIQTPNSLSSRRQIERTITAAYNQDQVTRENDERRSSTRRLSPLEARAVEARDMRSQLYSKDNENKFNSERAIVAPRYDERRAQRRDNRVFRDRTNSVRQSSFERSEMGKKDLRESVSLSRVPEKIRGTERRSREQQSERNVNRLDIRIDNARRFREGQGEIKNKVRRDVSSHTENVRIDDNRRSLRRDVRRSVDNPNERISVVRREVRSIEMRSEGRGEINTERREISNEYTRAADIGNDVRRGFEESDFKTRVNRAEIRNRKEKPSFGIRREIRDNGMRTRDQNEKASALRRNIRDEVRRVNDRDEGRREIVRAIRNTETGNIENRARINEVRRERRESKRFGNERVKDSESRLIERFREDKRHAKNYNRRYNERTIEIRNVERSRYSHDERSSADRNEFRIDLHRSRESKDMINENRMTIRDVRDERNRDIRREIKNDERRFKGASKSMDIRESGIRKAVAFERDNVILNRKARSLDLGTVRDNKAGFRLNIFDRTIERDTARSQMISQNRIDHPMDREVFYTRARMESSRNRVIPAATHNETEATNNEVANWQYVFYTLQGIYLCGLFLQMLGSNSSKKSKSRNWWSITSENLIKVD